MTLFMVKMIVDDQDRTVGYDCIDELLTDAGLRCLFDDGLIAECEVVGTDGQTHH